MSSHVSTNNELLTLWLKASGGLPADEARELIERLATMEAERADDEMDGVRFTQADIDKAVAEAVKEATGGTDAYDEGFAAGHAKGHAAGYDRATADVARIVKGRPWGPKQSNTKIVQGIVEFLAECAVEAKAERDAKQHA